MHSMNPDDYKLDEETKNFLLRNYSKKDIFFNFFEIAKEFES